MVHTHLSEPSQGFLMLGTPSHETWPLSTSPMYNPYMCLSVQVCPLEDL